MAAFRVFVCSTFADLEAERERVLEAVRRLQQTHAAMEYVRIGPGRDMDLSRRGVELYLSTTSGYPNARVRISGVPFRV